MSKGLICHISTTFNTRSGFAKRTLKIINECIKNDYDILLIIGRDNDIRHEDYADISIEVIPELEKHISIFNDVTAYKKIKKILDKYKPDLVHTHLAKAGIIGRIGKTKNRPKIIHTVHGPTFPKTLGIVKRFIFWSLEWYASRYTDVFIFVGEEIMNHYIKAKISSNDNSTVIYTARDDRQINYALMKSEEREALRKKLTSSNAKNTKIISYTGRLVPSKQQDHAINILSHFHKRGETNTHLLLIGKALVESEVNYENELLKLAKDLKLEKFVHFLGHRDDVLEIMDSSDAVILPSKYEGLPNVLVESILAGTPIVTYDVSGAKEMLSNLSDLLIVKQGDINLMAERVSYVLNAPEKFTNDYSILTELVKADFSNKKMLESKLKLYNELLSNKKINL